MPTSFVRPADMAFDEYTETRNGIRLHIVRVYEDDGSIEEYAHRDPATALSMAIRATFRKAA